MRSPVFFLTAATAAGLLISAPHHAVAQTTTTINFDNVQAGTVVNTAYSNLGITFQGQNAFSNDVAVDNIAAFSTPNALDGTNGTIDVRFTGLYPNGITAFSFVSVADPSGFGSNAVAVQFFGKANDLLFTSANYDQTITQTLSFSNLVGVSRVTLAPDAYYDNVIFTASGVAAPEPGTLGEVACGLLALYGTVVRVRRRK